MAAPTRLQNRGLGTWIPITNEKRLVRGRTPGVYEKGGRGGEASEELPPGGKAETDLNDNRHMIVQPDVNPHYQSATREWQGLNVKFLIIILLNVLLLYHQGTVEI